MAVDTIVRVYCVRNNNEYEARWRYLHITFLYCTRWQDLDVLNDTTVFAFLVLHIFQGINFYANVCTTSQLTCFAPLSQMLNHVYITLPLLLHAFLRCIYYSARQYLLCFEKYKQYVHGPLGIFQDKHSWKTPRFFLEDVHCDKLCKDLAYDF